MARVDAALFVITALYVDFTQAAVTPCDVTTSCYQCPLGKQINSWHVCDGVEHCVNGTDETHCDVTFDCEGGEVVPERNVCDGYRNCILGTDEMNCGHCSNTDYFHECEVSKLCIRKYYICDGYADCEDGSDEIDCSCDKDHEFDCGDGTCVLKHVVCDRIKDCPGGEDEQSCEIHCVVPCSENEFTCLDYKSCINEDLRCEGNDDCGDGSDEWGCASLVHATDVLLMNYHGSVYPICSTNWNEDFNDRLCKQMGLGSAVGSDRVELSTVSFYSKDGYLRAGKEDSKTSIIHGFEHFGACNESAVTLQCKNDACGSRSRHVLNKRAKILHGNEAEEGMWPWQVKLTHNGEFSGCGGSLLYSDWVLTAAHCVAEDPDNPDHWSVEMGTNNVIRDTPNLQRAHVTEIIMHENYFPDNTSDVALIKLSNPITVTDFVRPVCLPETKETFPPNEFVECFVTGWGATVPDGQTRYPSKLQELKMGLVDDVTCGSDPVIIAHDIFDADVMLCAGYNDDFATICNGDSGGPLVCRSALTNTWTQAGVVSWTPGDEELDISCKGYSVFAELAYFRPWIDKKTGRLVVDDDDSSIAGGNQLTVSSVTEGFVLALQWITVVLIASI